MRNLAFRFVSRRKIRRKGRVITARPDATEVGYLLGALYAF
jgi:hypothetical protein